MNIFQKLLNLFKSQSHHSPKGWLSTKIADDVYEQRIPLETQNNWAEQRRENDNVRSCMNRNGFFMKTYGRGGTIYYVEDGKLCEIGIEMSAVPEFDILVFFEQVDSWALPVESKMTEEKRVEIKRALIHWLASKHIKADLT